MPDVALSAASSPLAALLSGGAADSAGVSRAKGQNPFAALLDDAGAKPPAASKSDPTDPVAALIGKPVAEQPAILRSGTMPAPPPVQMPAAAAAQAVSQTATSAEPQPIDPELAIPALNGKSEDADDSTESKDEDGTDKLADAIASGPTAVLALAPVIVAPAQPAVPTQTPIQIDAPVAPRALKLSTSSTPPASKPQGPHSEAQPEPQTDVAVARTEVDTSTGSRAQQQTVLQSPAQAQPQAEAQPEAQILALPQQKLEAPRQVSVTETAPSPAALPPEVAKVVTVASQQSEPTRPVTPESRRPASTNAPAADDKPAARDTTAVIASTVPAAPKQAEAIAAAPPTSDPAPVPMVPMAAAKPHPEQPTETQQPAAHATQSEAAAAPASTQPRRRSDESAAPRRQGHARRRGESTPVDAAAAGLDQRGTGTVQAIVSRPVTNVQGKGDAMVEQTLTIAKDGAWLDSLAKDIANAGSGNNLHFKLSPENLGALSVAISQKDDGASIRLTADNQQTRDILVDAQPKLIAEARAQGLKVSDAQVDVRQDQSQSRNQSHNQDAQRWAQQQTGQNASSQNGQNRQSSPGHQPFVSNLRRKAEADSESAHSDSDALYA